MAIDSCVPPKPCASLCSHLCMHLFTVQIPCLCKVWYSTTTIMAHNSLLC